MNRKDVRGDRVADRSSHFIDAGTAAGPQKPIDPKLVTARNPYGVPHIANIIKKYDAMREVGEVDYDPENEARNALVKLMHEQGESVHDIAREVSVDPKTVRAIIERLKSS